MKKTLLLALVALLYFSISNSAQAQCLSYAGGPYSDQGIDVAGCDGTSLSAPYSAWLNEIYFTDVVAGGNYTFDICNGYDPTAWGGEATITAILNGTPTGGVVNGGTVLGTETGCSITFEATEDGTAFFILSTAADCGGDVLDVDNGVPTITTNSGVACGGCGNGTCDVGESYGNCPGDCPCSTTPVFASFSPTGQPSISPTPTIFCESFFTGDPAAAAVGYVAVAVFPGDGALYDFTNEDGFVFYGIDATGFFPASQFEPGFIGFILVTDDLIASSGGTTTVDFSDGIGCNGSLTINWATDFPGLVVADLCGEPVVSTPGADACADAISLDVSDGAINGPYSNVTATGEDPTVLVPPACFGDVIDPVTGENVFDNSVWFSFVGTGENIVLTTSVAGTPNPMPNADTQMGVYEGTCDGLIEIGCNDDISDTNYLSSVTVATEPGVTYYVVIDGYFYSDGAGGGAPDAGDFFINAAVMVPGDCMADYGTVIAPAETTICQDGIVGAFNLDGDNATADYLSLFVVTTGPELTILGYADAGTDIDLTGLPAGNYTFHAFNFLLADAAAIDAAVSGGATGFDVAALIADGVICADLDAAGIAVTILPATDPACSGFVCEANYGTVIPPATTTVCENTFVGAFNLDGDNTSADYTSVLVATTGPDLTILGIAPLGEDLDIAGLPAGTYTLHAFNFLNTDGDLINAAIDGGATGFDVAALIADGTICAALDATGVTITVLPATDPACAGFVCEADFGMVMTGSTTVCEGTSSDPVTVMDDNTNGYSTLLVITQGPELTIVSTSGLGSIDFSGFAPGDYTVHALNILDTDIPTLVSAVESGAITTGVEAAGAIADGVVCAALDVTGVAFTVLSADDPACVTFVCEADFGMVMTGSTTVCEGTSSDPVTVMDDNTNGYSTLLVITQGPELTIVGTSGLGSIDFSGFAPGDYTVHALNILDTDIPTLVSAVESGAITTGVEAAGAIADGVVCAALDVTGVAFTVLPANSEICNPPVPPTAENADFTVGVGTAEVTVQMNDYVNDPNGDPLTIEVGDADQGGSVAFDAATGILVFTIDEGFIGTATIPYTVTDGTSDPVAATVTITVELSCDALNPISIGIIELVTDPVSGATTSYLSVNGGLPEFDGSNYIVNVTDSEGAVLFSANDVPTGSVYQVAAFNTTSATVTLSITDGLGCSNEFEIIVLNTTLGVALVDLKGTVQDRGNLIEWTSASELNNDFYTLYRSTDGVNYQKIAQLDGKGTTSVANSYEFLDVNAPNGPAYYQLAQTDFDGTTATLGTLVLRRNTTALNVVQVAPVPATNAVNITFATATATRVQISMFDVAGKLVNTQNVDAAAGNNTVQLVVDQLAAGIYMLSLNDGAHIATAKIVKK